MSFSFNAKGSRDVVVSALESLSPNELGQDPLGAQVRDMLAGTLRRSADVGMGQQFSVSASGHAGSEEYTSVVTMTASIAVENVPSEASSSSQATATTATSESTPAGV